MPGGVPWNKPHNEMHVKNVLIAITFGHWELDTVFSLN